MTIEEIKDLLETHKISQRQLAEMLDVNECTVSRWLAGKQPIGKMSIKLLKYKLLTLDNKSSV